MCEYVFTCLTRALVMLMSVVFLRRAYPFMKYVLVLVLCMGIALFALNPVRACYATTASRLPSYGEQEKVQNDTSQTSGMGYVLLGLSLLMCV